MKPILLLYCCCFYPCIIFAQVQHIDIKTNGPSLDSVRKNVHHLNKKLSDSSWLVLEYDMHDTLMLSGTFKDQNSTMPHGVFKFYNFTPPYIAVKYDYVHHVYDSTLVQGKNYLSMKGVFINGEKTGEWRYYNQSGTLASAETYEHNKLNGPYRTYNNQKVFIEGQFINDLREGNWNTLNPSGEIITTDTYKKGEVVKTISHLNEKKIKLNLKDCSPKYDFTRYLNTAIKNKTISKTGIKTKIYSFTVDTNGRIIEPYVLGNTNNPDDLEVDTAIVDAILSAPAWQPAYKDNKPVEMDYSLNLEVEVFDDKHMRVSTKKYSNSIRNDAFHNFNNTTTGTLIAQ